MNILVAKSNIQNVMGSTHVIEEQWHIFEDSKRGGCHTRLCLINSETQAEELWTYFLQNDRELTYGLEQLWFQISNAYEGTITLLESLLIVSIIHVYFAHPYLHINVLSLLIFTLFGF